MSTSSNTHGATTYAPFALFQDDLVFLPSPNSGHVESYRRLFQKLHADKDFCFTAFGDSFAPRSWTDNEVKDALLNRDAKQRWGLRGMGDFAVGFVPEQHKSLFNTAAAKSRTLKTTQQTVHLIEGKELDRILTEDGMALEEVNWAGYACVRDATTTCLQHLYTSPDAERSNHLPEWKDMIELRYGLSPEFRGKGIITKAMRVIMAWAVEEKGARRFIAEAQRHNGKSGLALERLGLKKTDTYYFQDETVEEWVSEIYNLVTE